MGTSPVAPPITTSLLSAEIRVQKRGRVFHQRTEFVAVDFALGHGLTKLQHDRCSFSRGGVVQSQRGSNRLDDARRFQGAAAKLLDRIAYAHIGIPHRLQARALALCNIKDARHRLRAAIGAAGELVEAGTKTNKGVPRVDRLLYLRHQRNGANVQVCFAGQLGQACTCSVGALRHRSEAGPALRTYVRQRPGNRFGFCGDFLGACGADDDLDLIRPGHYAAAMLSMPMKIAVMLALCGFLLAGAGFTLGVYLMAAAVVIPIALVFLGLSE